MDRDDLDGVAELAKALAVGVKESLFTLEVARQRPVPGHVMEDLIGPGAGRTIPVAREPRIGVGAHRVECGHPIFLRRASIIVASRRRGQARARVPDPAAGPQRVWSSWPCGGGQ